MASSSKPLNKRKISHDAPISPPPLKRKVQSMTTQNAVSSFFTPASKKPPEKILWQERAPNDDVPSTLLIGKYTPDESTSGAVPPKGKKIAAFDFDSTLIQTMSGKKFASGAQDWKWWHASVPGMVRKMYLEDGQDRFTMVVVSNQAGLTLKHDAKGPKTQQSKVESFKTNVAAVFNQLDIPISIYAATEKDNYRKPRTGMWTELLEDYEIRLADLDLDNSIFIGDAAGRQASQGQSKDFSCSDRNFAHNVGIKFHTPEEFFLGESPRPFTRTFEPSEYASPTIVGATYAKKDACDLVLFCGSPGAGKSTFYWKHLEPLGYTRVNQDTLKSLDKCIRVADDNLKAGKSVAIDNTNADPDVRSRWVQLAVKHNVPIRCVVFTTASEICEHNDAVRALNNIMNPEKRTILPSIAFRGFHSRYRRPQLSEGFQDITEWAFQFVGSEVEREIWTRHWT
ncbi:PNK3P-domain-containing protein [Mollisia scopiformis]|uniref:PNK3P-domain-containing protein n=1 Tax=Mollisia scopiformis TaxID=149040 RepID=A0A194WWN7_MOLSC|nr:PNK3P-domain-containing protein [Mollisia scopiformis]KUJ12099.1 PNK3P-domain-containing protein [Mollisia scopiformis]